METEYERINHQKFSATKEEFAADWKGSGCADEREQYDDKA
jgi:hypothetical protein